MKKTIKSTKLQISTQTLRNLRNDELAVSAGGAIIPTTLSAATRCRACDSFTVPVTRCM
jgi:hypothetical protein